MDILASLAAVVGAYLVGSVSFAVVVSRLMGLADPRSYGSGNPGATNVLRTGNRAAALLTLAGDAAKGAAAVLLVQHFAPRFGFGEPVIALSALAVFCGHLFPVFHRFAGGKGVATAAGVLLALNPWLGIATLGTWVIIAFFFRYSSLAALVSAVFAPLYHVFLFGPSATGLAVAAMSALLVWRHQQNIANLIAGRESRIGGRKPASATEKAHGHAQGTRRGKGRH
jgi:glycerol-3-phosphate acyltransferase PlsY